MMEVPKEPSQASKTSTAEVKSISHKGWAAFVTFMAFITYVSTTHTCLPNILQQTVIYIIVSAAHTLIILSTAPTPFNILVVGQSTYLLTGQSISTKLQLDLRRHYGLTGKTSYMLCPVKGLIPSCSPLISPPLDYCFQFFKIRGITLQWWKR